MEMLDVQLQAALVGIIRETHGSAIDPETFAEVALDLFEDIAGLETADAETQELLIQSLWKKYHD